MNNRIDPEHDVESEVLTAHTDPTRPTGKTMSKNPVVQILSNRMQTSLVVGALALAGMGVVVVAKSNEPRQASAATVVSAPAVVAADTTHNDAWFEDHPNDVAIPTAAPRQPQSINRDRNGNGVASTVPGAPGADNVSANDVNNLASGPSQNPAPPSSRTQVPQISDGSNIQPAMPSRMIAAETVPNIGQSTGSVTVAPPASAVTNDPHGADIAIAMSAEGEKGTISTGPMTSGEAHATDGNGAKLAVAGNEGDYLPNEVTSPRSKYELQAGTKIPAVISQAVDSDLPGYVSAIVSEDVYDSIRGMYLLVPQGARLLGQYVGVAGPGQTRVTVAWTRLFFPGTGKYLNLGGMNASGQAGESGISGDVDTHHGRLLMTALKLSILQAGTSLIAPQNSSILQPSSPTQRITDTVGSSIGQVGSKVLTQEALAPTVHVRIGTRFNVEVDHDIVFPSPIATHV